MKKSRPIVDATSFSLEEWLEIVLVPKTRRDVDVADYEFPTDAHRNSFLDSVHLRSEQMVRSLLRLFLISGGTMGIDRSTRRWAMSMGNEDLLRRMDEDEFIKRLIEPPFLPWEGTTWVLDLLPDYPRKALAVLDAYFTAHFQYMPDGRLNGFADAEAIIRRRYLHWENPREVLLALPPDEFEFLIAALYEKLGYQTTVTQTSRDGGIDVEARRTETGIRELLLIQCKRYQDVVRVQPIREMQGVVASRRANKGVVVATCGFTKPARAEAEADVMIELIDFAALNRLLNAAFGAKWPNNISYAIRNKQFSSARHELAADA